MNEQEPGQRADGHSHYFGALEGRLGLAEDVRAKLSSYDLNILAHESALGSGRPDFRFTYFQYLASLYAEIYLDRFATNPAGLLGDLRRIRSARFRDSSPLTARDLRKLALWMATGSGKTLLAHVNMRQFLHYRPFEPQNILVLTPSETLSEQHLEELRLSGISASHVLDAPKTGDVQVLEITKLYVDGLGNPPRGGVRLPTSVFEGPNLVLVDEGHKGTATATDSKEERKWRDIRRALEGDEGFTFEYSATFAQITEDDDDLLDEYGKAILFDYGYRHFWKDGYGKDYRVINLKEEGSFDTDELLLAGLLVAYEQERYFQDTQKAISQYNLERPLMIFVGSTVTGKTESEVLDIVKFLDRVLRDPEWALSRIDALLTGKSGLPRDLFAYRYPYLGARHLDAHTGYDDLRARMFMGTGHLTLHMIRRGDGEIGLRAADASQDRYCGVINVGNASGFFKKAEDAGIATGEDDHISDSLFDAINLPASTVNFLIGAKKFIEGWSSWRVSVMGLLKVGKSAGPQVIQLFGRGVRLLGKDKQLRRSAALPGDHPENLNVLETLHIFGLKADYMQAFNEAVRVEGVTQPVTRTLVMKLREDIEDLGLYGLDSQGYDFAQEVLTYDPSLFAQPVKVDLSPRFEIAYGPERTSAQATGELLHEGPFPREWVRSEDLFLHLVAYKQRRDWHNVYITRAAVEDFISNHVQVVAPQSLFHPTTERQVKVLESAAREAVEKGLDRFAYSEQRRRETKNLKEILIDTNHSNFPRIRVDGKDVAGYRLEVPEALVKDVDRIIKELGQGKAELEDLEEPLPRLHIDAHLYGPLLLRDAAGGGPRQLRIGERPDVRSRPSGLVASELRFLVDLREHWEELTASPDWKSYEVFLLRNLPRRGVGFFQTAGFYPDFLLWLKKGNAQALAFVEPHGMVRWDQVKIDLLRDIRALTLSMPTLAYIVTETQPHAIGAIGRVASGEEWLRNQNVLLQDGAGYVADILSDLRGAVDAVVHGSYVPGSLVDQRVGAIRQRHLTMVPDSPEIEDEKFVSLLPVYSLEAAAGYFGSGGAVELEGWLKVDGRLTQDMFVARAVGHSMEPRIADGDLCVFKRIRAGTKQNLIVLAQWAGAEDPETGGSYAVKKYSSEKVVDEDSGELKHFRITLSPLNPEFESIVLSPEFEDEVQIIAELVQTLNSASAS